jgi:N-methylhydantoinase B
MRAALAELPTGRFTLSDEQDNGTTYNVTIEIAGGELTVDLRDNPPQNPTSANVSRDGATIGCQVALMNIAGIRSSANAGHFRPLRVLTTSGTVFDPSPEAACSIYSEVRIRLSDAIVHCLAPHLGQRLPAGGFASVCGTFIGGPHPDTGRHFTIVEPQVGGWGASAWRDGNSAMFSLFHGDTFNCPAEVAEARYGMLVERLELAADPGGEGRFRGGQGILLEYRVRADGCFFSCAYTRSRVKPWSLDGGIEGTGNYAEVVRVDGSAERYAVATAIPVNTGDLIRIHTGTGAGYGDPRERDAALVSADVRDGLLTRARARAVYGAGA